MHRNTASSKNSKGIGCHAQSGLETHQELVLLGQVPASLCALPFWVRLVAIGFILQAAGMVKLI